MFEERNIKYLLVLRKFLSNSRKAIIDVILKAGHIPSGMEMFSAGNEEDFTAIKGPLIYTTFI